MLISEWLLLWHIRNAVLIRVISRNIGPKSCLIQICVALWWLWSWNICWWLLSQMSVLVSLCSTLMRGDTFTIRVKHAVASITIVFMNLGWYSVYLSVGYISLSQYLLLLLLEIALRLEMNLPILPTALLIREECWQISRWLCLHWLIIVRWRVLERLFNFSLSASLTL